MFYSFPAEAAAILRPAYDLDHAIMQSPAPKNRGPAFAAL
jgi:hypothetical protein